MSTTKNSDMHKMLVMIRDAVLGIEESTKHSTDTILSVCESMDIALADDDKSRIYQACAVQDLTNQRVKKILDLLQQIETGEFVEQDELLEGPQRHGSAMSQDDVDSILNGSE